MADLTLQEVQRRAQGGDPAAQELLAQVLEQGGQAQDAAAWMARAAASGRASALARLGLWELAGFGMAARPADGVRHIVEAAQAGDPFGLHLAAVADAGGIGTPRNLARAISWLRAAAGAGDPHATRQMRLLGVNDAIMALQAPFERVVLLEDPRIELLPDFLPPWACDYVIALAGPTLTRGKVIDDTGAESVREERTNTVMNFGLVDSDVVLELINARAAAGARLPPQNAEGLGVLHYAPGERYKPHVDYIPDTPENAAQLAQRGQRIRTLLIYLNEDFDGGATTFPRLEAAFKPPRGAALVFDNVRPDGSIDPLTLHEGAPPTRGQKWVISKWFREKPLRPGPDA